MKPGYYWVRSNGKLIIMELDEYGQWFKFGVDSAEWDVPVIISGPIPKPEGHE